MARWWVQPLGWALVGGGGRAGLAEGERIVPTYRLRCVHCGQATDARLTMREFDALKRLHGYRLVNRCGSCGRFRFTVVPTPFSFRMTG